MRSERLESLDPARQALDLDVRDGTDLACLQRQIGGRHRLAKQYEPFGDFGI